MMHCACTLTESGRVTTMCGAHEMRVTERVGEELERLMAPVQKRLAAAEYDRDQALIALGRTVLQRAK